LITTFALTLNLPLAHWLLPSPSPSICPSPTDHYLRSHPHGQDSRHLIIIFHFHPHAIPVRSVYPVSYLGRYKWNLKIEVFKFNLNVESWKLSSSTIQLEIQVGHICILQGGELRLLLFERELFAASDERKGFL
jgi:hypothetical protein